MHTDHENLHITPEAGALNPVWAGYDPRDTLADHAARAGEQYTGRPYVFPGTGQQLPAV